MTIDKVVRLLRAEYEHAKGMKMIHNPLAWALYKVWKIVDSGECPKITTNTEKALEKMGRAAHRGEAAG